MDTIIAILITVAAFWFIFRRFKKMVDNDQPGCGCDCGGDCSSHTEVLKKNGSKARTWYE